MTKNPAEPDDMPEPQGGRAAERLRDLMLGRFPADSAAEQEKPEGEEPAEGTGPTPERDPTQEH